MQTIKFNISHRGANSFLWLGSLIKLEGQVLRELIDFFLIL